MKTISLLLLGILSLAAPALAGAGGKPATVYSPGGWPTLHQDPGNRRSVDTDIRPREYRYWQALAGATVLTAPVTSPDGQQIYVTTGLPAGNSNLHAFSITGTALWQAEPWRSPR